MSITYSDVESYCKCMYRDIDSLLHKIDDIVTEKRDKGRVPVYLTKCRIKKPESVYLKTKLHGITDLEEIMDYAGFRVLCLFEQDITGVHECLISVFVENSFNLVEFKLINWLNKRQEDFLSKKVKESFPDIKVEARKRESGYKSIHYVVTQKVGIRTYCVEIQLRTLLQDVWGELEHALSYKKSGIHPHIKKSFILLSRDLATMDMLIRHLKDISDKEQVGWLYSAEDAGPNKYFGYEPEIVPELFQSEMKAQLYKNYIQFMQRIDPQKDRDQIALATKHFADLRKEVSLTEMDDKNTKYFVMMEEAFFLFWKKEYDKAMEKYEEIVRCLPPSYIVHFRIGEIFFIKGRIERSLASFDKSDTLLSTYSSFDNCNRFRIRMKLAYIYWLLGDKYVDFTISMIRDAENIYEKHKELFKKEDYHSLINASCWYNLINYILRADKEPSEVENEKLSELEDVLENPDANANMFDTAAWFRYNRYLKMGNRQDLDLARNYCKEIGGRGTKSTYQMSSSILHMNHIKEIMSAV